MLWLEIAASEAVTQALAPWPEVLGYMHARVRLDPTGGPEGPKAASRLFEVQCPMTAAAALATGQTRISLSVFPRPSDTPAALARQLLNWTPPEHVFLDAMLALLTALGPSVTVLRVCQSHPRAAPWPGGLPRRWLSPFARVRHLIVMAPLDIAFLEQDLAAPETVAITGYELEPDGTHYEHARRLAEGRWLGRVAANLESLEMHGCGVENIAVPLPKLHTFSASFLPRGSLEDLTPALRHLYVSCSAAAPWHSLSERDVERATTSLHAMRLPASLQLLSVTAWPPCVERPSSQPAWPWLAPLLSAVRRNHPQGGKLHTLMIQAETQDLAELAAAEVDRWLGEEVPGCGAPLRSLRALSICPHGYYASSFSLGMWSTRFVVTDMQSRARGSPSLCSDFPQSPSLRSNFPHPEAKGSLQKLISRPLPNLEMAQLLCLPCSLPRTPLPSLRQLSLVSHRWGLSRIADAAPRLQTIHLLGTVRSHCAEGVLGVSGGHLHALGPTSFQCAEVGRRCGSLREVRCMIDREDGTGINPEVWVIAERQRAEDAAHRKAWLTFVEDLRRSREAGRLRCARQRNSLRDQGGLASGEDPFAVQAFLGASSSSAAAAVPWFWHNLAGRVADMLGWESPAPSLSFLVGDWYDQLPGFEAMVRSGW
jgi:hypothetical protein